MLHTIDHVTVQPNRQLLLRYAGGEEVLADFRPVIRRGGVFTPLDDPEFFERVEIGGRGRYVEWPGGLDFCADALWEDGQRVAAPEEAKGRTEKRVRPDQVE